MFFIAHLAHLVAFPVLRSLPSVVSRSQCVDINNCRTLSQIVTPAASALIAANYLSVHRNVPEPATSWFQDLFIAGKVFLVALIFPEWIFVWALRNFIIANRLKDKLEQARLSAYGRYADPLLVFGSSNAWRNDNRCNFRISEKYTITHAFFLIMGGVHIYNQEGLPLGPLDVHTAIRLIKDGSFLLPPIEKIKGLSKTTYLGKSFAIIELRAFLLPCLLRIHERLPMANFEIMALAHSLIAILTFAPWWSKPMNVESPERVSIAVVQMNRGANYTYPIVTRVPGFHKTFPVWQVFYAHIFGNQDCLYNLLYLSSVPAFWSGDPADIFARPSYDDSEDDERPAFFTAAFWGCPVMIVFGLIHCIGWDDQLNTHAEQLLWKGASATIVAVPLVDIVAYSLCIIPVSRGNKEWPGYIMASASIPTAAVYIVARIILLVLSFISLRRLPLDVYKVGDSWGIFQQ